MAGASLLKSHTSHNIRPRPLIHVGPQNNKYHRRIRFLTLQLTTARRIVCLIDYPVAWNFVVWNDHKQFIPRIYTVEQKSVGKAVPIRCACWSFCQVDAYLMRRPAPQWLLESLDLWITPGVYAQTSTFKGAPHVPAHNQDALTTRVKGLHIEGY